MQPKDPVIRFTGRRQVLALYETHLVMGKLRAELTEQCFDSDGRELATKLAGAFRTDYKDIMAIRETVRGHRRFELRTAGKKVRFRVNDGAAVHDVLGAACADRYVIREVGQVRLGGAVMVFLSLIAGLMLLIGSAILWDELRVMMRGGGVGETPGTWAGIVLSIVGPLAFFVYALFFRRRLKWVPLGAAPVCAEVKKVRAARTRKGAKPLYSPAMGWTLKGIGVAYWIALCGPWGATLTNWMTALGLTGAGGQAYLWILAGAPAPLLIYAGHRLGLKGDDRAARAASTGGEGAVVFLRPFEDDLGTTLQPRGMVAEMAGIRAGAWAGGAGGRLTAMDFFSATHPIQVLRMLLGRSASTSEEALAKFFRRVGPVVAIGKPGERLAAPGAQRMYVADADWQARVTEELDHARAVIMQPGTTEGVAWEMEQVRQRVAPTRVLMCLVSFVGDPEGYARLCALADRAMGVRLPRIVPFLKSPAFVFFDGEWNACLQLMSYRTPALWPLVGDACNLEWTLAPFVEGLRTQVHRPPSPVRGRRGLVKAAAVAAGIVLGLVLLAVPAVGIPAAMNWLWTKPARSPASALMAGEWRTLKGKDVPYVVQVPATMSVEAAAAPLAYHSLSSDRRLEIVIVAATDLEDLSGLAEALRAVAAQGIGGEATVQVNRETTDGGGDRWREVELTARNGDVAIVTRLRATSGPRGTVLVKILERQDGGGAPDYAGVSKRVLDSLSMSR